MDNQGIKKLAELSRLELSESEVADMTPKINAILEYVNVLKSAPVDNSDSHIENASVRNIMRPDQTFHQAGVYSDDLIASAPANQDRQIKVKKIL